MFEPKRRSWFNKATQAFDYFAFSEIGSDLGQRGTEWEPDTFPRRKWAYRRPTLDTHRRILNTCQAVSAWDAIAGFSPGKLGERSERRIKKWESPVAGAWITRGVSPLLVLRVAPTNAYGAAQCRLSICRIVSISLYWLFRESSLWSTSHVLSRYHFAVLPLYYFFGNARLHRLRDLRALHC